MAKTLRHKMTKQLVRFDHAIDARDALKLGFYEEIPEAVTVDVVEVGRPYAEQPITVGIDSSGGESPIGNGVTLASELVTDEASAQVKTKEKPNAFARKAKRGK